MDEVVRLLSASPKPVVAAVASAVVAQLLAVAAAADMLVCSNAACFMAGDKNDSRLSTSLLTALTGKLGSWQARKLYLNGAGLAVADAAGIGFAHIVGPGEVLEAGFDLARNLAALPPFAFNLCKRLWAAAPGSLDGALGVQQALRNPAFSPCSTLTPALRVSREGSIAIIECEADAGAHWACTLNEQFDFLESDAEIRAVVLIGDGFAPSSATAAPPEEPLVSADFTRMIRRMQSGAKPVVVAVEAASIGERLSLVLAADFVVAGAAATFRADFLAAGRVPDAGLLWRLWRNRRPATVWRWLLRGETLAVHEAQALGLIQQPVATGAAKAAALTLASRLAAMPPLALSLLKACLVEGADTPAQARRTEADLQPLLRLSAEHREAVAAFMEKRPAQFIGT